MSAAARRGSFLACCTLLSGLGCVESSLSQRVFISPADVSRSYVPVNEYQKKENQSLILIVTPQEAQSLGLKGRTEVAEFGQEKLGVSVMARLFKQQRNGGAVRAANVSFHFAWTHKGQSAECRVDLIPKGGTASETPGRILPGPWKGAPPERELGEQCTPPSTRWGWDAMGRSHTEYIPEYCPPQTLRFEFELESGHYLPTRSHLSTWGDVTLGEPMCHRVPGGQPPRADRVEARFFFDSSGTHKRER